MVFLLFLYILINSIPNLSSQNQRPTQGHLDDWEIISDQEALETTQSIAIRLRKEFNNRFPFLSLPDESDLEQLQRSLDTLIRIEQVPKIQHLLGPIALVHQFRLTTIFCLVTHTEYTTLNNPGVRQESVKFIQDFYAPKTAKDQVASIIAQETAILESYQRSNKPIPKLQEAYEQYRLQPETTIATNASNQTSYACATAISWLTTLNPFKKN